MTVKKIDATRPLYVVVGVGDLAVEIARSYTADVQARFAKVELEPKALRDQAITAVNSRLAEISEDAKQAPTRVGSYVNETVAEVTETYGDLATRGRDLVSRIRRQQATQDAQAAAGTTVAKAKTARTQTTKSAKRTTGAAKQNASNTAQAAKKTGATAKTNAKATTTAAKKSAAATTRATADAAEKVGD